MPSRKCAHVFVATEDDTLVFVLLHGGEDADAVVCLQGGTCVGIAFLLHPRDKFPVAKRLLSFAVRLVGRQDTSPKVVLAVRQTKEDVIVPRVLVVL